jgi:hypothetical protein
VEPPRTKPAHRWQPRIGHLDGSQAGRKPTDVRFTPPSEGMIVASKGCGGVCLQLLDRLGPGDQTADSGVCRRHQTIAHGAIATLGHLCPPDLLHKFQLASGLLRVVTRALVVAGGAQAPGRYCRSGSHWPVGPANTPKSWS